jgi:putative cofactor-binding repeat protein
MILGATEQPVQADEPCDRYVLGIDAWDDGDCSTEGDPCRTVPYAVSQADPGDHICVAKHSLAGPLVYTGTVVITKSITLDGAWDGMCVDPNNLNCAFQSIPCDPVNVTLDAERAGRVISITGNIAPTIHCFTITGGDAAGQGGDPGTTVENDAGGGIYSRDAAPIITHNVITGNYGCDTCPAAYGRGGGLYLLNAPATAVISGNVIANNVADETTWGKGGGIMLRDSDAQILSNVIEYNRAGHSAGDGGGIEIYGGMPVVADNVIHHNVAGQAVVGTGGGIHVWSSTPARIERNRLYNNWAIDGSGDAGLISTGGGIAYRGRPAGTAVIRDNILHHNIASPLSPQVGYGGGIYLSNLVTPSIVSGNLLWENYGNFNHDGKGGGMYVNESEVTIIENRLTDNAASWSGNHGEGGGLLIQGGTVLVHNNVITGNFGEGFPGFPSTATGFGGGVAAFSGNTTLLGNRIEDNGATNADNWGWGGGIYGAGGTIRIVDNQIARNWGSSSSTAGDSSFGGGVALTDTVALIEENVVLGNTATEASFGAGGGIYAGLGTYQIVSNVISGNLASATNYGYGGGIYVQFNEFWLDANTILDNQATTGNNGYGGGVRVAVCDAFTVTNNIIARNGANTTGSGIAVTADSVGQIVHNTIAQNQGGIGVGVHVDSDSHVALTNNIVISHWQGIANGDPATSIVTATHTLFDDNGTDYGPGVTSVDEVLGPADLLPDYHLDNDSNAIAHALPLAWITHDVDGDARPYRGAPDVGADEVSCLAHVVGGGGVYFTIQEAVEVAASGDTVRVAEGTCYENVAITESLTLEGGWDQAFSTRSAQPASVTIIDGARRGRAISITEVSSTIAPVIDGFTLTGGDATDLAGSSYGYDIGGGLYSWYADTTVSNCIVRDNVGSTNDIAWGGGLGFYRGNPTVSNCLIEDNVASTASNGYGGGVYFRRGNPTLQDSIVQGNVASTVSDGRGGGAVFHFCALTMDRTVVRRNIANLDPTRFGYGGGVFLYSNGASGGPGLMNNIVVDNRLVGGGDGSGLYVNNIDLPVLHTTLARNTGGNGQGIYVLGGATVGMKNTIVVSHAVGVEAFDTGTVVNLEATLWGDGVWANTVDMSGTSGGVVNVTAPNVWEMPGFVDATHGDYHIRRSSAAVDAGVSAGVIQDIDGDARPLGAAPDLGADETWALIFLPLILRGG